jgi:hypothetical protein
MPVRRAAKLGHLIVHGPDTAHLTRRRRARFGWIESACVGYQTVADSWNVLTAVGATAHIDLARVKRAEFSLRNKAHEARPACRPGSSRCETRAK